MISYSVNAYDVTNFVSCFEKFLAYTLFLLSFIVVRHQMAELNWGAFLSLSVYYMGIPEPFQNRVKKPTKNYQSKTMLLFKTYTLEFEFDRHLEHMVSCHGLQSGLPVVLVNSTLSEFYAKMTV